MHAVGTAFEVIAVAGLLILGRAVFVFFSPYRPCRWCRPGGLLGGSLPARIGGHQPGSRRKRRCWRCKGTRLTGRLGARHVHRVRLALRQAREERPLGCGA